MAVQVSERYGRTAALVFGLMELVTGLTCIGLQLPLYTHEVELMGVSTGVWAGISYIVIGIITIASWEVPSEPMVKLVLVTSVGGIVVSSGAMASAVTTWAVAGFNGTVPQDEDTFRISTQMNWLIFSVSVVMFGLFISSLSMACHGLGICCAAEDQEDEHQD